MARTRFNSPSVSMVAPTILCRRSECRGAPTGASLRVPHFPGGPPGTCGSREDPHVIAVRLDPEHLVPSGHGLPSRDPPKPVRCWLPLSADADPPAQSRSVALQLLQSAELPLVGAGLHEPHLACR